MSDRMTVEEWHVKNGGSNARNRDLQLALWDWQNDRVELMQQNAEMLAALKDVEWVWAQGAMVQECPWCKGGRALGHTDNCRRQQAIAKAEGGE